MESDRKPEGITYNDHCVGVIQLNRSKTTAKVRPRHLPVQGRAPRVATNEHRRGSRRGERSTSSSSDDPPGEGDPDEGDPEPHKYCELPGCGKSIDHLAPQAHYCSPNHTKLACKRRKRAERALEQDSRRRRVKLRPCECGTGAITDRDPELGLYCFKCTRWLEPLDLVERNGHVATLRISKVYEGAPQTTRPSNHKLRTRTERRTPNRGKRVYTDLSITTAARVRKGGDDS